MNQMNQNIENPVGQMNQTHQINQIGQNSENQVKQMNHMYQINQKSHITKLTKKPYLPN